MSWGTGLQIIGIIITTLGTLLAIESLWRLRLQRTIKLIEDETNKRGVDLVAQIIARLILSRMDDGLKEKIGLKDFNPRLFRRERLKVTITALVLRFSQFVQDVLKKINEHLIRIGVSLIITGMLIQILGILI